MCSIVIGKAWLRCRRRHRCRRRRFHSHCLLQKPFLFRMIRAQRPFTATVSAAKTEFFFYFFCECVSHFVVFFFKTYKIVHSVKRIDQRST